MTKEVTWRGDNLPEVERALSGFHVRLDVSGDELLIDGVGLKIKPLKLGDRVEIRSDGDGVKIFRAEQPKRWIERWMVWNGENWQEAVDFVELGNWSIGMKMVGRELHVKGVKTQIEPTILQPGDSIIENELGLCFRRAVKH